MRLAGCCEFTDVGGCALVEACTQLRELNLSRYFAKCSLFKKSVAECALAFGSCTRLTDRTFVRVGKLQALTQLSLSSTRITSLRAASLCAELHALATLDVSSTPAATPEVRLSALACSVCPCWVLSFSRSCPFDLYFIVSLQLLLAVAHCLPNIEVLLASCGARYAAAAADLADAEFPEVRTSDDDDGDGESGEWSGVGPVMFESGPLAGALIELGMRCARLRVLGLEYCGVCENGMNAICWLHSLQELYLSGNGCVTGASLFTLLEAVPGIRRLVLCDCVSVRVGEAQELSARGVVVTSRGLCSCRKTWHMAGCLARLLVK